MINWNKPLALAALALWPAVAGAVQVDYVTVGSPGNAADPQTGEGAVPYTYAIGRHEVTNSQYAEFLNAKAKTDPKGLYAPVMQSEATGGINRTGADGNFTYTVKPGYADKPVAWVTWYDAARFANWLHNGQGNGDTETGAYTFPNSSSNPFAAITRNPGAQVFLPNRNEWYKAAYFDPNKPGGPGYWDYATRTDQVPFSDQPPGTGAPNPANTGNFFKDDGQPNGYDDGYAVTGSPDFNLDVNYITDGGAYAQSASGFGTFDQGGNVWEYDERIRVGNTQIFRGISGGSFGSDAERELSSTAIYIDQNANSDNRSIGFRVAAVPEPAIGSLTLLAAGTLTLMRRRGRA